MIAVIVMNSQRKAGALLNYLLVFLNMGVGLLYTPYMLRSLGAEEYGLYSLASSIIAYVTVLDMGLGNATIRYTAKLRAEQDKQGEEQMLGMFFSLYSIIAVITMLVGIILSFNIDSIFSTTMTVDEQERTATMMRLMTLNLAISFPMSIWGGALIAYEHFVFNKIIRIVSALLNPLTMVLLLHWGYKAVAMVVVSTVFNILTHLCYFLYCRIKLNVRISIKSPQWSKFKEVYLYSFWVFLNTITDQIYWSTGQIVLGIFYAPKVIAVYAVAMQFRVFFFMFSTSISGVFLPKITSMVATQKSDTEISDLFVQTGRIQFLVLSFFFSCFVVLGRQFIFLWAGEQYEGAYYVCLILFLPLMIHLSQALSISILQARNKLAFRSVLGIVSSVACLILSFVFTPYCGVYGPALAVAISMSCIGLLVMNVYLQQKHGIDMMIFWRGISRLAAPAVLTILGGIPVLNAVFSYWGISWLSLTISGSMFASIYLIFVWLIGMNQYEKSIFKTTLSLIVFSGHK